MKRQTLLIALVGGCWVTLLSCSKTGLQFDDSVENILSSENEPRQEEENKSVISPLLDVPELIRQCDEAKTLGRLQSQTIQIDFEDNIGNCEWGQDGNLAPASGTITARAEQVRNVPLPLGASVCQIGFEDMDEQSFRYDDNIILTLNSFVLVSTNDFTEHFNSHDGYFKYDWNRLTGALARSNSSSVSIANQYCAGQSQGHSSCRFPARETVGKIELDFDERIIQNILGMTNARDLQLSMITTGDSDRARDCHHNPIQLRVKVDYFY